MNEVESVKGFFNECNREIFIAFRAGSKPYEYDIINQKLINKSNHY